MTEILGAWRTKTLQQKATIAARICYELWEFFVVRNPRLAENFYFSVGTYSMIATVPDFLGEDDAEWEALVDRTLEALETKLNEAEHFAEKKKQMEKHNNASLS